MSAGDEIRTAIAEVRKADGVFLLGLRRPRGSAMWAETARGEPPRVG